MARTSCRPSLVEVGFIVRAAESAGEFEESENIQADVGSISSECELSRGLETSKAEAHREERRKWGSKISWS